GIKDRTHLRWFTEENAVALLNGAGLRVVDGLLNGLDGPRTHLFDRATAGLFRHWLAKQYIMAAERGDGQGRVTWRLPPRRNGAGAGIAPIPAAHAGINP